jgi:hypothetical protein
MWLQKLFQHLTSGRRTVRRSRPKAERRGVRLRLEQLEDRMVPSNFTAATASDLIADFKAANLAGGSNTITLAAPTTSPYNLTAVDNATDGATGLPVIAANDNLTIVWNGDTIARSMAAGTPAFRLFDVASGASLTLANLTLQGGLAYGSNTTPGGQKSAEGGAIYSYGTLVLNGVTVQHNIARGYNMAAYGGGLFVGNGTATLTSDTVDYNQALGALAVPGLTGILLGCGGGLYVGGGTVTLTSDSVDSNSANFIGGGLYVTSATVSMFNDTVEFNSANKAGGGLYIRSGTVCLDAYTVHHVINNTAPSYPNIYGSYTICP